MNEQNPKALKEISSRFPALHLDPRIAVRAKQFLEFVNTQGLTQEQEAKKGFKDYLGFDRVFRGLCLEPESPDYRTIFQQATLLSHTAAQKGLEKSVEQGKKIGGYKGILSRLHSPHTCYEESGFVFSVARFPEPQILPAAMFLYPPKKAYLLEFDMPVFDQVSTIADITAQNYTQKPYLFLHDGILFNGSDPDVEIFVLHKTHVSNLSFRVFDSEKEIKEFCEPYKQKMQEKFGKIN